MQQDTGTQLQQAAAERDALRREVEEYSAAHMEGQRPTPARPGLWQRYWTAAERVRQLEERKTVADDTFWMPERHPLYDEAIKVHLGYTMDGTFYLANGYGWDDAVRVIGGMSAKDFAFIGAQERDPQVMRGWHALHS